MRTLAKPESRAHERRDRAKAKLQAVRAVYAIVDRRDGYRCRACQRPADPRAIDLLKRGERHHIVLRSAGGKDATDNLCLLCASCHADRHAGRLHISGHGDGRLVVGWL